MGGGDVDGPVRAGEMDGRGVVCREAEHVPRHRRDGAGETDEAAQSGGPDGGLSRVDGRIDVDQCGGDLGLGGRVAGEVALGDAHRADVEGEPGLDRRRAAHELGRAAAEVDDEIRARDARGDQVAGRAGEGQVGLLGAAHDLGRDVEVTEDLLDPGDEVGGIARIARGRGRDEADRLDAQVATGGVEAAGRDKGPLHRGRVDDTGAVHAIAESHDVHLAVQVGQEGSAGLADGDVSDEQSDRVGAAVDGPDTHQASPSSDSDD